VPSSRHGAFQPRQSTPGQASQVKRARSQRPMLSRLPFRRWRPGSGGGDRAGLGVPIANGGSPPSAHALPGVAPPGRWRVRSPMGGPNCSNRTPGRPVPFCSCRYRPLIHGPGCSSATATWGSQSQTNPHSCTGLRSGPVIRDLRTRFMSARFPLALAIKASCGAAGVCDLGQALNAPLPARSFRWCNSRNTSNLPGCGELGTSPWDIAIPFDRLLVGPRARSENPLRLLTGRSHSLAAYGTAVTAFIEPDDPWRWIQATPGCLPISSNHNLDSVMSTKPCTLKRKPTHTSELETFGKRRITATPLGPHHPPTVRVCSLSCARTVDGRWRQCRDRRDRTVRCQGASRVPALPPPASTYDP